MHSLQSLGRRVLVPQSAENEWFSHLIRTACVVTSSAEQQKQLPDTKLLDWHSFMTLQSGVWSQL